jgi:hypothetical protein
LENQSVVSQLKTAAPGIVARRLLVEPRQIYGQRDSGARKVSELFRASTVSPQGFAGGLQPGKNVLPTIFEVCPLVALALGLK